MAQTEYYNEDYESLDELLARAYALGVAEVKTELIGDAPALGPLQPGVRARAQVTRADGSRCIRLGTARLGDAQVPEPLPPERDLDVEARAERRALRAVIRTAYPNQAADESKQPSHVKRVQALVRKAAERMGVSRDQLAEIAHERYHVASLNDVTPEQADLIEEWLEPFVQGEAA